MITEQNLIDLEFKRNDVSPEESGEDYPFHYYTLEIGDLSLISNSNDNIENDTWDVQIFDFEPRITNLIDLVDLINVLRRITGESIS